MNFGRYSAAVVAVFVVRTVLNWLFYGQYMMEQITSVTGQWEGAFREVIPAYILADLLFAAFFVWLWARAGAAFGNGAKAGAGYGLILGVLAAVIPSIYHFYSVTYITYGVWTTEIVYQLAAHVVIGVVAALIYPIAAQPATATTA